MKPFRILADAPSVRTPGLGQDLLEEFRMSQRSGIIPKDWEQRRRWSGAGTRSIIRQVSEVVAKQSERFRQMSPEERWQAAMRLYWSMRKLKASHIRTQHPEWSDDEIDAEVKRAFMNVRD